MLVLASSIAPALRAVVFSHQHANLSYTFCSAFRCWSWPPRSHQPCVQWSSRTSMQTYRTPFAQLFDAGLGLLDRTSLACSGLLAPACKLIVHLLLSFSMLVLASSIAPALRAVVFSHQHANLSYTFC